MDTFQVIFRGKLLSGFSLETTANNIAALFKTDSTRASAMLQQPKWVIKTGLSKEAAQKYQDALRGAGMMVAIMQDDPVDGSAATVLPVVAAPQANAAESTTDAVPATPVTNGPRDEPLEYKPKVPAYNPDLSAYSLAEPGVILIDQVANKAKAVEINTQGLSLADVGVVLAEAKAVAAKNIDTSALSVEEIKIEEKPLPALWLEQG
jgi:hypothetical protein